MIKRLRFGCQMGPEESVAGALFRSASRHVLVTVFPVLREASISRKSINFMQLLSSESIVALADVIRCDPSPLGRDVGVRQGNAGTDERGRQRIAFGDLVIEGCHLDHRRRRVSPASLGVSPHHRTDWLNRLLPYCPWSLDLLIETCPSCRSALGWTRPLGVECCEHCEYDLRKASTSLIDPALAHDYRDFVELCSLNGSRRKKVIERLPSALHTIAPGTLVRFALHAGQLSSGIERVAETHLSRLPPADMARVAASGMRLLGEWPNRFRDWLSEEASLRRNAPSRYSALKLDLRHLARHIAKEKDGTDIVQVRWSRKFGQGVKLIPA